MKIVRNRLAVNLDLGIFYTRSREIHFYKLEGRTFRNYLDQILVRSSKSKVPRPIEGGTYNLKRKKTSLTDWKRKYQIS